MTVVTKQRPQSKTASYIAVTGMKERCSSLKYCVTGGDNIPTFSVCMYAAGLCTYSVQICTGGGFIHEHYSILTRRSICTIYGIWE
jgi:hypothetical protein